jgi:hypothetical protein
VESGGNIAIRRSRIANYYRDQQVNEGSVKLMLGPRLRIVSAMSPGHRWNVTVKGVGMHSQPRSPKRDVRVWLIAATALAILAVTVVIAVKTDGFGLANSNERVAQQRCESDVRGQLASPVTAKLSDVIAATSELDPDSRDMFPLLVNEPLKGVDRTRITVWNVSGTVEAQTEVGTLIRDPFTCRAYFVDGSLTDTLVLFDHEH